MSAGQLDLTITQGDLFELPIVMKDGNDAAINLSTAVIKADIKQVKTASTALLTFTITPVNLAQGSFKISLSSVQTAALKATKPDNSNILYYDLQVNYGGGDIKTELAGTITIIQQITL